MKLVLGRAGSGKSFYCMNEIKENILASTEYPLIYIVPEQYSLNAEYDNSYSAFNVLYLKIKILVFQNLHL